MMNNRSIPLLPVILSGGVGSRLWPVSRESHPKPFIRLKDGQSLLQKAFLRAAELPDISEILTVTNRELLFKTQDEYNELEFSNLFTSFILEPFGKNTAPAIALAALYAAKKFPDAILLILVADHIIDNQSAFCDAVSKAYTLAGQDYLVTFGIQPDRPETGYGYIEADGNMVKRFIEKPDRETAKQFLEQGSFLWNSGMFCFKVSTFLKEMQEHSPQILESAQRCFDDANAIHKENTCQYDLSSNLFAQVSEDSIDYALMERSSHVAVVPCHIGWNDVGSWRSLEDLLPPDAKGNSVDGEVLLLDVENCAIRSNQRLIAAAGLRDMVIVDTADALLVVSKEHTQTVKDLYNQLKDQGHESHKLHRTVHRPWGTYTVLEEGNRYKIKRLKVKPGQSMSMQMHCHRSEHWIVVSGMAKVLNGTEEKLVACNESTYIPAGHTHRVSNPGIVDLVMIEVQSGEYLGEDDIVRFEDNYGRVEDAK